MIELENAAAEKATAGAAFQQLRTYQALVPALFATNAVLVVSDGVEAQIGAIGAGRVWFKRWRTIGGCEDAPASQPELQSCWRACSSEGGSSTCCGTLPSSRMARPPGVAAAWPRGSPGTTSSMR